MTLAAALVRFESIVKPSWPTAFEALSPGADEHDIQRIRDAIAPFGLPGQVEAPYRWHAGGDRGLFGGWRMRGVTELLDWYRFTVDELDSPRTLLPVFDDQIVNIVTLDAPGREPSDESVWWGHTHDGFLRRVFNSLERLLDTVSDAADAASLIESPHQPGSLGLPDGTGGAVSLDDCRWDTFRLVRNPGSYQSPPEGMNLSRHPDPRWPLAWNVNF